MGTNQPRGCNVKIITRGAKTISKFWVESCVKDLGTSPSLTGREIEIIRIKELKKQIWLIPLIVIFILIVVIDV